MFKEIVVQKYFCDKCGKEITGTVFSPLWGELALDGDGNYNRDGDIINIDICGACLEEVTRTLVNSVKAEEKITENDKNSEKNDEKPRKKSKGGNKSTLDDGKIMALHRAGWTNAKIADEMGVSGWTIGQHIQKMEAGGAFVDDFEED